MTEAEDRDELAQGLRNLRMIVDDVRSLLRRSRLTFWLLGGMTVLLIGFGVLAVVARIQANDNKEQRVALEGVVDDLENVVKNQRTLIHDLRLTQRRQQRVSQAVILEACRSRNEANRQIRAEFRRAYLNVYRLGERTPERRAGIQDLIDGIASAAEQDRDCGGGIGLGPYDYPQPRRET